MFYEAPAEAVMVANVRDHYIQRLEYFWTQNRRLALQVVGCGIGSPAQPDRGIRRLTAIGVLGIDVSRVAGRIRLRMHCRLLMHRGRKDRPGGRMLRVFFREMPTFGSVRPLVCAPDFYFAPSKEGL